jgi:hypothetical protein
MFDDKRFVIVSRDTGEEVSFLFFNDFVFVHRIANAVSGRFERLERFELRF